MRLIVVENLNQYKKINFNIKNCFILTTSGSVAEKLNAKSIPYKIFNIENIMIKLTRQEDKLNSLLFKTLSNLEKFIKNSDKKFEGDISNFTKLNMYHFQFMLHEINTRYSILNEIIKSELKNYNEIIIFSEISPIYKFDNYELNPWVTIILNKYKNKIRVIKTSSNKKNNLKLMTSLKSNVKILTTSMHQKIKKLIFNPKKILILGDIFFNLQNLKYENDFTIINIPIKNGKISSDYHWFKMLNKNYQIKINNNTKEIKNISNKIKIFRKNCKYLRKLNIILKFDLLKILELHLINFYLYFPKLITYNQEILDRICQKNNFDFFLINSSTHWLQKYTSIFLKKKNIPVISLQHGGGYGTHNYPKNEFNDIHFSDYFLTYGKFFNIRNNSLFKNNAKFIPIRDDYMSYISKKFQNRNRKKIKEILFISDGNSSDFICSSKRKQNDLSIYLTQKDLFKHISKNININITFRPFGNENTGIIDYLRSLNHKNITIDNITSIYKQISRSDLIMTDSSPGTVLNQCLYFNKKLVFYTFNRNSFFFEKFMKIIEKSCYVVKNEVDKNFIKTKIGNNEFSFLKKINTNYYKKNYLTNESFNTLPQTLITISKKNEKSN